ncbi:MAG: hypothetical protein ACKOE6_05250 [Flammeovirgaceae bacterium]
MQDEIDLLDLGIKVVGFFRKIFWRLVIGAALGAGLGFGFYSLMPKQYESKMLVQSEKLTYSLGKSLLDDLNQLAREKSWDSLGAKLWVTPSDAEKIISIQLKSPIDRAEQLKESEKSSFEIIVRVYDLSILVRVQKGLERYLGNNRFTLEFETMKKDYYVAVIAKLNEQIAKLKLQQEQFDAGKLYVGGKDAAYYFDPSVFNSRILDCELKKLKYQDSVKLVKNVKVINGFVPFQKPVFPKLRQSILMGVGLGLLAALGIALLKRLNKIFPGASSAS